MLIVSPLKSVLAPVLIRTKLLGSILEPAAKSGALRDLDRTATLQRRLKGHLLTPR